MTLYEARLRQDQPSIAALQNLIAAEEDELRRAGRDTAKDRSIKLCILRKLLDEATTPPLPLTFA